MNKVAFLSSDDSVTKLRCGK